MAIKSGFFHSVNGDRKYNATDVGRYLGFLISDGVYPNPSTNLQVTANTNMTVKVAPGKGWAKSQWLENDSDYLITLEQSNMVYDRIDAIIMRLDNSIEVRNFTITFKTGTPGATPVAPAMTRTEEIKEYCLAHVLVKANSTQVLQTNITDTRADTSICGWVTSLIDQVDTSELFIQWQTAYEMYYDESTKEFDEWFSHLREELKTSTLVREYTNRVVSAVPNQVDFEIGIVNYNVDLDILEVYINGLRLVPEYEYTFTATSIKLVKGVDINQAIELVVFKSIDGYKAETVISQVEALQVEKANKDVAVASLLASNWTNYRQTVTIQGITSNSILIVDVDDLTHGIRATAQATNSITFSCVEVPTTNISAKVLNLGVQL